MNKCRRCGAELSPYDCGFYKKMVNRSAEDYMCITCIAAYYRMTEEKAWEMIRRYQMMGCTLFPSPGQ